MRGYVRSGRESEPTVMAGEVVGRDGEGRVEVPRLVQGASFRGPSTTVGSPAERGEGAELDERRVGGVGSAEDCWLNAVET